MPRLPNPGDKDPAPFLRVILPESRSSCFPKEILVDLPPMPGIKPPLLGYLSSNLFAILAILLLLLLVIRARSQGSGCTAAIKLMVHPVF
jgi:hypothetical protein